MVATGLDHVHRAVQSHDRLASLKRKAKQLRSTGSFGASEEAVGSFFSPGDESQDGSDWPVSPDGMHDISVSFQFYLAELVQRPRQHLERIRHVDATTQNQANQRNGQGIFV
jgi:hypothetical protein